MILPKGYTTSRHASARISFQISPTPDLVISPSRSTLEDVLQLEPQERGYEVLLIEVYYESLLNLGVNQGKGLKVCPVLLTFLDLYHFPLRGLEQAEFMAERAPELKRIYKNGSSQ